MPDRAAEWDAAIERYKKTGVIDNAGYDLIMNSCPTCADTGMDDGQPCNDCPKGRALTSSFIHKG